MPKGRSFVSNSAFSTQPSSQPSSFTTLWTSQVISVTFYNERQKSDKFCSEALISAWDYFTCRKSTTRDPRLYFPSKGSHTLDFYSLKKIHRPRAGLNPRTSDPVASMITTGPKGSISQSSYSYLHTVHLSWYYLSSDIFLCRESPSRLPFLLQHPSAGQ